MKPTVNVVRAVGVEFLRRLFKPLIMIAVTAAVVLLGLGGWLTSLNGWWWIFEAMLIVLTVLLIVLLTALRVAMRLADPPQSVSQKRAVGAFVDKLERTAENVKTPQPIIYFRVIRDVVRPRAGQQSFIAGLAHDSKSLAPDFVDLQRSFND